MFILGGSIDTQLVKLLCNCNFSVLTFGNVNPWGGGGGQLTLNLWSHFATATFLYSPLEMFILGEGSIDAQLVKSLCNCNFSVLTFGNVHPGGGRLIDTQLVKSLCNCNFSALTFGNVHPGGGRSTLNLWSHFATATFLYSPLEMFILGGGRLTHQGTNVQFSQITKYSSVWTFLSWVFSLVHKIKIQTWLQT